MEGKASYDVAVSLRDRCCSHAAALQASFMAFTKNVCEFYNLMRWTGVDCSEADYEALFGGFVYDFEQLNVELAFQRVNEFMALIAPQAPDQRSKGLEDSFFKALLSGDPAWQDADISLVLDYLSALHAGKVAPLPDELDKNIRQFIEGQMNLSGKQELADAEDTGC